MIFSNSFSLGRFIIYFDTKTFCDKPAVAYFTSVSFLPAHNIIPTGALSSFCISFSQQKATIKEYNKTFTTYPFSDPDPVPEVGKIYPYYRFDGYTDKPVQKEWKVVELENDYIKVMILPEIGGKIWTAIEKSTGKSFIYYNHVIKFRDVAMRGPWTSGGLEANYGIIGHTPNCATPVDYTIIEKADGSVSCVIGVLDLLTRTSWRIDTGAAYQTKCTSL